MEAMQLGKPVIARHNPGNDALLQVCGCATAHVPFASACTTCGKDTILGELFNTPAEAIAACQALLEDASVATAVRERAQAAMLSKFNEDTEAAAWLQVVSQLFT
jgi:hypothetical protein